MNINVNDILTRLSSCYFGEPLMSKDYRTYCMTSAQMQTVQSLLFASEPRIGPDLEDSISFLLENGSEEDCGHYLIHDPDSGMRVLTIWKEQQGVRLEPNVLDGKLYLPFAFRLEHNVLDGSGHQIFEISLPTGQIGSHTHKVIDLVCCGMSQEEYYRWHSYYASETDYQEKATFNNWFMVPRGWEHILTLEEIQGLTDTANSR